MATANTKHKALYIEDNPVNARLVMDALNHREGFEVLGSPAAEFGLTLAEENNPDIILMDTNLPGINGIAALKILKSVETTSNIPVIAVTAHSTSNDIQAGRDAGFDDYLKKPIDLKQLFTVIENSLLSQAQHDTLFYNPESTKVCLGSTPAVKRKTSPNSAQLSQFGQKPSFKHNVRIKRRRAFCGVRAGRVFALRF